MSRITCLFLVFAFSTPALAQRSGTLTIEKPAAIVHDTIKVMLGAREFFKPIKVKYKPSAKSKALVFKDYTYRKKIPSGFYVVTYPETGSIHSAGEIKDGKMHGKWRFQTLEGGRITFRSFDNGELLKGSKVVTVGN